MPQDDAEIGRLQCRYAGFEQILDEVKVAQAAGEGDSGASILAGSSRCKRMPKNGRIYLFYVLWLGLREYFFETGLLVQ